MSVTRIFSSSLTGTWSTTVIFTALPAAARVLMGVMLRRYTEFSPLLDTPVVLRVTSGLGYATRIAG